LADVDVVEMVGLWVLPVDLWVHPNKGFATWTDSIVSSMERMEGWVVEEPGKQRIIFHPV